MIRNGKLVSPEVRIETTNLCNARCTICPREKMTRPKRTMDFDTFRELAIQCKDLGAEMATLFGYGEPLVDKGIYQKIAFCNGLGLKTTITTNASLMDDLKGEMLLDAGLTEIRFSVHGFGKDYEEVHGLDWDETIDNIDAFLAICGNECVTNVSVIPLHDEPLAEIRDFWEKRVDYLEIWRPHNWTDGRAFREVKRRKKTCGRPFNGPIQINADGKMMVCCFDYDGKLTIGDTNENSIQQILEGDELRYIQDKHMEGNLFGLLCESCDQLNIEDVSPLLYSNRDFELGKTSTFKTKIGEEE